MISQIPNRWFFLISLKLSVAIDLPQTYRQTVPQTWPCITAKHLSPNLLWVRGTVSVLSGDEMNVSSQGRSVQVKLATGVQSWTPLVSGLAASVTDAAVEWCGACTWHCSLHYLFLQATPLLVWPTSAESFSVLSSQRHLRCFAEYVGADDDDDDANIYPFIVSCSHKSMQMCI